MGLSEVLLDAGKMRGSIFTRALLKPPTDPNNPLQKYQNEVAAAFVMFMAFNAWLTGIIYSIPLYLGEVLGYDDDSLFWWKVFITVGFVEITWNFLCIRWYTSYYEPSITKGSSQVQQNGGSHTSEANGSPSTPQPLPWSYCVTCQHDSPPRAHHCKVCKKCTLKRDHHCFMVGTCIGHRNQRYFCVFVFYLAIFSFFCLTLSWKYLSYAFYEQSTYIDYIPPLTIFRVMCGYIDIHVVLMQVQIFCFPWIGPMCVAFTCMQFVSAFGGKTMHEALNSNNAVVFNSIRTNLRSMFGDYWALNFIFPLTCCKVPGDGTRWPGIYKRPARGRLIVMRNESPKKSDPKII